MKTRGVVLVLSLSVLAACSSDKTTGPAGGVSGSVTFTFTGGGGGTYNANGVIQANADPDDAFTLNWAAGAKVASTNSINVAANVPTTSGKSNLFTMDLGRQTAGSSTISIDCDPSSTSSCAGVALIVGNTDESFDFFCSIDEGSITVASVTDSKASGTFSGTGECFDSNFDFTAFTVTNGSFNVPLLTDVPSE